MTEGFSRETHSPQNNQKHSFVRIRDVLAFSFQHAPMRKLPKCLCRAWLTMVATDILEFSGIAWPNPGMWTQAQSRSVQGPVSCAQRPLVPEIKEDEDAHAHSPRRPSHQDECVPEGSSSKRHPDYEDYWANQSMPPLQRHVDAAGWNQSQPGDANIVRQNGPLADPFLEPRGLSNATSRRGQKMSSEDTPMPDVPSYEQSRHLSGMTGISYEHKDVPPNNIASHEAIMNQLVEALSPLKSDDDGPHNPTNTPSSGRVYSKPSIAAQARAASRRVSGIVVASPNIDKKDESPADTSRRPSPNIISTNPGCSVQGKKEGDDNKENTPDNRVAGADFTRGSSLGANILSTKSTEKLVGSSDSKRKRPLEELSSSAQHNCIAACISSSPSKKVSKMDSAELLVKSRSPHTPDAARDVSGGVSLKAASGRG
jgi:hypothetical protein